jgi:putative hemolysin
MSTLVLEILLIVALIMVGGAFAAAETSMISMRESQVRQLALTRGKRGQRLERLVSDPNQFLAAVQIGVTFATMLSSAFGAATVADRVSGWLRGLGMSAGLSDTIALVGTTLVISFISLVLGELAPKRLGLQRSETIALVASGPLSVLARLFRPVVWVLGKCTNGVVRLLGGDPRASGDVISQEELQSLVEAHESLTMVERRVIADVFAAEDTRVREVMVARRDVEFLQGSLTVSRAARLAVVHRHSRFPVIGEDVDDVIGVVRLRDLLAPPAGVDRSATVADIAETVSVMPGTKGVLDALTEMRTAGQHLAIVVDEYGGTDGIVTIEDLIEEIVGEMRRAGEEPTVPGAFPVGSTIEVDGRLNLDDFTELTGRGLAPGPYDTVAGYLMAQLGRVPRTGDIVEVPGDADRPGVALTVAGMDGRRVARILVVPRPVGSTQQGTDPDDAGAVRPGPEPDGVESPAAADAAVPTTSPPTSTPPTSTPPTSVGGVPKGRART